MKEILFLNLGVRYSGTYNTISENPSSDLHLSSYGKVCHPFDKRVKKSDYEIINAKWRRVK